MGVLLTPIIVKETPALAELAERRVVLDGNGDALLFGAPRLLRFLTIRGREFLPSKGAFRRLTPEVIVRDSLLAHLRLSREQLVDLAILVGTDFNDGIKGIGPKKALGLVQTFGRLEDMPDDVRAGVPGFDAVREVYLSPSVTTDYALAFGAPDQDGLVRFLCEDRGFSRDRVKGGDRPNAHATALPLIARALLRLNAGSVRYNVVCSSDAKSVRPPPRQPAPAPSLDRPARGGGSLQTVLHPARSPIRIRGASLRPGSSAG